MNERRNLIIDKTFQFSLNILALYKKMLDQKEFVLSKQLVRSGTSIGANVEEATAALTKKEFTAKMSIASKEARETKYWLKLLSASQIVNLDYNQHIEEVNDIVNILTAIIKTSQKKESKQII